MFAQDLEIRQLSPGKSHWVVDTVRVGPVRLCRGSISRRALLTGTTPPGFATLVCPRSAQSCIDYWGKRLHFGCIGFEPPGSAIQIVFPEATEYLVLQLPVSMLERISSPLTAFQTATRRQCHHLSIEASRGAFFIRTMDGVIDQCLRQTDIVYDERGRWATGMEVADSLIALVLHGHGISVLSSLAARNEVLNRALRIIHSQREPLPMNELARASGVSLRTLQRIFSASLSLTPQKYQRWNRMYRLRQDLSAAHPDTSSVTKIAGRWGFTELGRLASEYRQLFGESPRVTLMRDQCQSNSHVARVA